MASVPAWGAIQKLGYKPALYLASEDTLRGVVLLVSLQDPSVKGVAWWDGDWSDERLREQIKWSASPVVLLSWAMTHPIANLFETLLHLLRGEVLRTAN